MMDFMLAKYAQDSADSDFEDDEPKINYVSKIKKLHHRQNDINFELFNGTFIIDEDQTYAINLVGQEQVEIFKL